MLLVLFFLLFAAPPFICMELHSDVILFDVYARNLQKGGVAYRDWCETNLPGMALIHWGIRSAIGWRSESLRAVDLAVIGTILFLIARWFRDVSSALRLGLGIALFIFYLGSSEWCHVQRDPWMLLPALAAMYLRRKSLDQPSFFRSFGEGLLWAAAFWIKPFVAVPCLLVWLASVRQARQDRVASVGSIAFDGFGILAGGLALGALGIVWLVTSGAWPYFLAMATDWNREYFTYDVMGGQRSMMILGFFSRSFPWIFIHLAAIPIAIRDLIRGRDCSRSLLAAFYLGWFGQALLLQHLFDYVHVPGILLGFAVVFGAAMTYPVPSRWFVRFVLVCVIVRIPILFGERLTAWPQCWAEGSSPAVRDRVSRLHRVRWGELQGVADSLRSRDLKDGELTCFNMPTAALYRELDVESATRYQFFQNNWLTFRRHRPQIYADLIASRQRFVVVDLAGEGSPKSGPWESRVVHQSGGYVVLEMTGTETGEWLADALIFNVGFP